jgi:hypothetical protein
MEYTGANKTFINIDKHLLNKDKEYYILLTPWSRVLEKLTGSHLDKKFPTLYGTQRFITPFSSARHLSLY